MNTSIEKPQTNWESSVQTWFLQFESKALSSEHLINTWTFKAGAKAVQVVEKWNITGQYLDEVLETKAENSGVDTDF